VPGTTVDPATAPALETVVRPRVPVHLGLTLGPLRHGLHDPTIEVRDAVVRRATRTPEGPATEELRATRDGTIEVRAWGPGAAWVIARVTDLLGLGAGQDGFEPRHSLLRDLQRRFAGLRIGRSAAVMESLVPAVLEQKVAGPEAQRSYRELVRRHGEPAPGPIEGRRTLYLPPDPARLATLPSWAYHAAGVERRRGDTIRAAAARAGRLEALVGLPPADAAARLRSLPGVGAWTAAEVTGRALGDADAVPVGDYNMPNLVCWLLAGVPRGDDERMLELLAPFRPYRLVVLRLLEATGWRPARRAPRAAIRDIRGI